MAGRVRPQKQGFISTSKVIAEFVDEIPQPKDNLTGNRTSWQPQDGVKEALTLAMEHPRRAMLLVKYIEGPPSQRRSMAKRRAQAMVEQGYTEMNGWTVRAVDGDVYVMYNEPW